MTSPKESYEDGQTDYSITEGGIENKEEIKPDTRKIKPKIEMVNNSYKKLVLVNKLRKLPSSAPAPAPNPAKLGWVSNIPNYQGHRTIHTPQNSSEHQL